MLQKKPQKNSKTIIFKITFDRTLVPDRSNLTFWEQFGQQLREELTKKRSNNSQYITEKNKIKKILVTLEENVLVYITLRCKCRSRPQILESCHYWRGQLCEGPKPFMSFPLILFDENATEKQPHCIGFTSFADDNYLDAKSGSKKLCLNDREDVNIGKFFALNVREPIINTGFILEDLHWKLLVRNPFIDPLENLGESLKSLLAKRSKPDARHFREDYNDFLFGFDPELAKYVKNGDKDNSYHIILNRLSDVETAKSTNIHQWILAKIILDCRYGSHLYLKERIEMFELNYLREENYREKIILNDMKLYSLCQEMISSIQMGKGYIVYQQIRQIKNDLDRLFMYYIAYEGSDCTFLLDLHREYDNDVFMLEQCFYMLECVYENQIACESLIESVKNAIRIYNGNNPPVYYSNSGRDLVFKEIQKKLPEMERNVNPQCNLVFNLLYESIRRMVVSTPPIIDGRRPKKQESYT